MLSLRICLATGLSAGILLSGCGAGHERPTTPRATTTADWRRIATEADRGRLRGWRDSWMAALGQVRDAGQSGTIAPLGALIDPDHTLAGPLPPPGDYRCRTLKLGRKAGGGTATYASYPFFDCRIEAEGEVLGFAMGGGVQRPVGLIFPDGGTRAIFLGTLVLGDELAPLQYGRDAARDMIGYVERVGERRWRLVLPAPGFESLIDVIELVPADQG